MQYISRADWGSTVPPGGWPLGQVNETYVHHFNSGISSPTTVTETLQRVRSAQQYHISLGWGDIGYSWLVDDLGTIVEGRGWDRTGAHTYGFNSKGYGICWIGDSNVSPPSAAAYNAIAAIIIEGIATGKITANPTIVAHRDRVPETSCCGDVMYAQLPHIRNLVLNNNQTVSDEEDIMMRSMVSKNGTVYLVDGMRGRPMPGTWPEVETALRQMIAAGVVAGNADGSPKLWPINDAGINALSQL